MKTAKAIACIILISVLLSSCTASRRINDLTIVQAMSLDCENSDTKITVQYLNLFANSGSTEQLQGNITETVSGKGNNATLAVSDASRAVANDIFFGQNKLIVFGIDYAQSTLEKGIEYLLSSESIRPDVVAAICTTKGEDILKSKEMGAKIPAENVYNLLNIGEEKGKAAAVTVCDLLNLYSDETSDIFLPVLSADKDSVKCEGIAVFSNERLAKTLGKDESFAFMLAKNKVKSGIIALDTPSLGRISLEIISAKAKHGVEIVNGNIVFNLSIRLKLNISEAEKTLKNKLGEKEYREIEALCEQKIKTLCTDTVRLCFDEKSDPFMCGRYLYMKDMELYNSLKPNWRDNLKNIKVSATATTSLNRLT